MSNNPAVFENKLGKCISSLATSRFEADLRNWIEGCLEFDSFTILAFHQNRPPDILDTQSEEPKVHAKIETVYRDRAYLLDPFHELHVQKAHKGLYWLNKVAPSQFLRSPYYLDYYRGTTMLDELVFLAYPRPGVSVHICLGRNNTSGKKYTNRDFEKARRITPIVTAFIEARWSNLKSTGPFDKGLIQQQLVNAAKQSHGINLSPRQAEIALLVLRGRSSVSIGARLGISPHTVKVIRKQLYRKCGISSQGELFALLFPLLNKS